MKAPAFWNNSDSLLGKFLNPIGKIYGWVTLHRFKKAHPYQADVPVICVGNLSVGGTGKTPICLALGKILKEKGIHFYFLNHGYKSKKIGIEITSDITALDVGDEAMLLATLAPTIVDPQRARGAQIAQKKGAKAIIMDDGFQNPSLIKTLSFIVVDGKIGFGNHRMIPAGPLREPIAKGLDRADAVIISGEDKQNIRSEVKKLYPDMPILTGHFEPNSKLMQQFKGKKVMAFCGIGRPSKFFDMLTDFGIGVIKTTSFPDHYFYTRFDIEQLLLDAGKYPLLTTMKDYIKISPDMQVRVVPISGDFLFDNPEELEELLKGIL